MPDLPSTGWIMLESNPDVMTKWATAAGVDTSKARFHDVYGLDEDLLSLIPQPVKFVVVLFPNNQWLQERREEEDERVTKEGQHPIDPSVIWMPQTIHHACGTMAILHGFANSDVETMPESPLATFIAECRGKTPQQRAKLLEASPPFAKIHAEAVVSGQSAVPSVEEEMDLHYTCFASLSDPSRTGSSRLVELNGGRKGPVDRGECTDVLRDVAKYLKEHYLPNTSSAHFNVLVLAASE
ncbi:cysteine proteinase [Obba rivulosa]|uniref:Ubiquitin carboxyl-terminal hydrolase n=1 Tax=Obba rivulosa TaxID=1052685 RepID=A0A8E2DQ24_9APHY|nr:cysteine proteinase [Obba rivulosa]